MIQLILAADNWFSSMLMVAGLLLLLTIVLVNFRKRVGRTENMDPREKIERDRQVNSTRNDLRQMMVDLEEVTRQFSAQLDAKSRRLEKLIEEADHRIAQLGNGPASTSRLQPHESVEVPPPVVPADPLTQSVYQMADQGVQTDEIARRLDEHIGKVELILALRQHG